MLAEASSPAQARDRSRLWPHTQALAAELGMTADQAVTRIAALPAWVATAETDPVRSDPEAGA
jgi:hypothetical protein